MKKQICSNKTKIITMFLLVVMLLLATLAPIKSVGAESTALVSDGVVNSTVLSSLYKAITGSNTATYSDVLAYAQTDRTCATLKTNNGGTAITVNFGGFEWLGVYLTTSRTGDAILDLWMKEGYELSSKWSGWGDDYETGSRYWANLYGTSLARAYVNNGSNKRGAIKYADSYDTLSDYKEEDNPFAKLLGTDLYTKYISTPSEIEYQENETNEGIDEYFWSNYAGTALNESYGTGRTLNRYDSEGTSAFDPLSKEYYLDWQYDYLWLPSSKEIAGTDVKSWDGSKWIDHSMWKLADEEFGMGEADEIIWTRSSFTQGGKNGVVETYCLWDYERISNIVWSISEGYVRPALHLNLTALNASTVANTGIATNILSVVTLGMSCTMFGLLLFFRKRTKRI